MRVRRAMNPDRLIVVCASLAGAACATAPPVDAPPPAPVVEEPFAPAPPPPLSGSYDAALTAIGDIARSQYVARNCVASGVPDPAYDGFEVKRCVYGEGGLTAVVYALNPTAENVALWIANACQSAGRPDDAVCANTLVARIRESNGFIFPVAGDVVEIAADAGPSCASRHGDKRVHVYFRDGITIETERGYTCETYAISESDADAEAFKKPASVFDVGRIATLTRADYASLSGVPLPGDDEWRAIVRDSYLNALRDGRYSLLDLLARKLFR